MVEHAGKVYAGTDDAGVFASQDGGQTWKQLRAGLPERSQVFALSTSQGELLAGLYHRGLYTWQEQEGRWNKTSSVVPLALASVGITLIAGHNPGGLRWSQDRGTTWSLAVARDSTAPVTAIFDGSGELTPEAPVWALESSSESVFAGASDGVFYSEDHGRSWLRARGGIPEGSPGVAFLVKPGFVLAGVLLGTGLRASDSAGTHSDSQ